MYDKICKVCGQPFQSTSPSKQICERPHYRTCEICGKDFILPRGREYDTKLTCCSKECTNIKRGRNIKAALSTKPKGYNAPKTLHHRVCKYCGKEFDTYNAREYYCEGPHYKTCEVCGKQFEVDRAQIFNKTTTCSNACRIKLSLHSYIGDDVTYEKWMNFCSDPEAYIHSHFDHTPTYLELTTKLGMASSTIQQQLAKHNLEYLVERYVSTMEQEVMDYIKLLGVNNIIHNDRKLIYPKELDIYLPDYNVAFECNPTVSHNSSVAFLEDTIISPLYHQRKTELCEAQGIRLFHIFGYEWTHNQEIIKSMICNILRKNTTRIFARHTAVKEVSYNDTVRFLNLNHRQGWVQCAVSLGLYYGEELVSIMTFGKARKGMNKYNAQYELLRFCSKKYTSVIGGASKLFKHFIDIITEVWGKEEIHSNFYCRGYSKYYF